MLALMIGPEPGDLRVDGLERLREVWIEYRSKFRPSSWAVQFWQFGRDLRLEGVPAQDEPVGCPGCDD
jgi:hypothetical protein